MPQWLRHQLLIVAVAVPVLFFNLGTARLWDRDEPRNAQCVVEMLQRHDWIVPMFNGELRTHKPVLTYWLMMSSYAVFGVSEFAARFWSAALGVGTILCTYHLGRRLFHPTAGLWAALALTPALMFNVASRAATPDAPLIFCVTATLAAYVHFAFKPQLSGSLAPVLRGEGWGEGFAPQFPRSILAGAIVFGLMALAVLAKGPVGIVLPLAIMVGSLWIGRCVSLDAGRDGTQVSVGLRLQAPLKELLNLFWEFQPLTALVMLLLIAAPWYAWVAWRTEGEFLAGFLWEHNLRRAAEPMEGHSGPAVLFYPATLLIGFFPASVFLVPSLLEAHRQFTLEKRAIAREGRTTAAITFCLTWIVAVVGLFSLAQTKLPSYVTPCYPALAVLVGNLLERWTAGKLAISERWLQWSLASNAVVGVVVVAAIYGVAHKYLPGAESLALIGLVLVAGGGGALACHLWLKSHECAAAVSLASGLLFSMLLFGLGPAAADRHQQSHVLLATLREHQPHEIAAWHCLEPSWVFYLGRPIQEVEKWEEAADFLAAGDRLLIMRDEDYAILANRLPGDVRVLGRSQRFLKDDAFLVLGRERVQQARTAKSFK